MEIREQVHGSVLEIRFSNPPVNALSVRSGLCDSLNATISRALPNDSIQTIIVAGADALFSAGADIVDFEGDVSALEILRRLLNRVEQASKPIIMAINGLCLGGGLELALAGHYRIAGSQASFGLPEVTLGLLPGGGGTQRLPRLIGAQRSIEMMLSGKPIDAAQALDLGLIDELVDSDPVGAALRFIAEGKALAVRPTGARQVPVDIGPAIAAARPRALSLAANRILDAVDAARAGDLEHGLATEARLFAELMASEASRGLRHVFFSQRLAARLPDNLKAQPQPIKSVTVVGGGLMGTGIAIALLNAGLRVNLVEARAEALEKVPAAIQAAIRRDVDKGRLSQEAALKRIALFSAVRNLRAASDAQLFIEAVYEDMSAKTDVFRALDEFAPPNAILASNTSTLDLNAIAAVTTRPADVMGLHFFSPANIMRLLEIVRGAETSPTTLATAMSFSKRIGKIGVVAGVCDGFIGNRLFEEYLRQAYFLLEEGALPQQIDAALQSFGLAMGPFRTMDLAGQDIGWSVRKRRAVEQPNRPYSAIPDLVCELGRFGQKTKAGFYLYPDGRTPQVDPSIDALVLAESARLGVVRRTISDEEIVSRCMLALVNEGAKVVAEGIAYRPADVDIVYVHGYGFPAERGGPMFYADQRGLASVLETIRRFAASRNGWAWEPAPLLVELVVRGASLQSLNR
jgi:3-hydroxyacyl-CoA dehydrogenase